LAYGWVGIGLRINIGLIVVMVPALLLLVPRFGAVGAAMVWLTLNAIAVAVAVPWTHRRLLVGEAWKWLVQAVGPPLAAALAVVAAGRFWIPGPAPGLATILWVGVLLVSGVVGSFWATPRLRDEWRRRVLGISSRVG